MADANGHNQRVSILVVDDYEAWRRSFCSMLEAQPDLQVIGEASDGLEAIQKAQTLKPDLVLLDINLPRLNGLEAEKQLCQLVPRARVIFVSQNSDPEIVHAALNSGAKGYVLKADAGDLLSAITAVIVGEKFVSRRINMATTLVPRENPTELS